MTWALLFTWRISLISKIYTPSAPSPQSSSTTAVHPRSTKSPKAATAPLRQAHDVWGSSSLKLPFSLSLSSFFQLLNIQKSKSKCPAYRPTPPRPSIPTRKRIILLPKQPPQTPNPPPQPTLQQQQPPISQTLQHQLQPQLHPTLLSLHQRRMPNQAPLPASQHQHKHPPLLPQQQT